MSANGRIGAGRARYFPIDEALSRSRVRALRAMRFRDWSSLDDIAEALGIGTDDDVARTTLSTSIGQAKKRGEVEQAGGGRALLYRITKAGRAWLANLYRAYDAGVEAGA